MTINIRAKNMDLTDAIRQYAEDKFTSLDKFYDNILHIEVDLGLDTNHHNKGEIYSCTTMVDVPNKLFRVTKQEKDLYKAIDKVRDHLREEITSWKEKNRDLRRS
ncbi:ribosome-associated translation inhibitor RaiA [Candidatus Uhrbacteria bacterium]|nr:ribosome-associated translation inhibitor RaiA [Candidatus Uhrbacteria bacterium]